METLLKFGCREVHSLSDGTSETQQRVIDGCGVVLLHFLPWYWTAGRASMSNECIRKRKDHLKGRLELARGQMSSQHFECPLYGLKTSECLLFDSLVDTVAVTKAVF